MIAIEILDQRNNVKAEGEDNGMNLSIVSLISLLFFLQLASAKRWDVPHLSSCGKKVDHFLDGPRAMHIE